MKNGVFRTEDSLAIKQKFAMKIELTRYDQGISGILLKHFVFNLYLGRQKSIKGKVELL